MINDFYVAVLDAVGETESTAPEIAAKSLSVINTLCMERSKFDLADVVAMLSHLSEWGIVRTRRQDEIARGCVVGARTFYTKTQRPDQAELFGGLTRPAEPNGGMV